MEGRRRRKDKKRNRLSMFSKKGCTLGLSRAGRQTKNMEEKRQFRGANLRGPHSGHIAVKRTQSGVSIFVKNPAYGRR